MALAWRASVRKDLWVRLPHPPPKLKSAGSMPADFSFVCWCGSRRVSRKSELLHFFENPGSGGENFDVLKAPEIFGGRGLPHPPLSLAKALATAQSSGKTRALKGKVNKKIDHQIIPM